MRSNLTSLIKAAFGEVRYRLTLNREEQFSLGIVLLLLALGLGVRHFDRAHTADTGPVLNEQMNQEPSHE